MITIQWLIIVFLFIAVQWHSIVIVRLQKRLHDIAGDDKNVRVK